MFLKVYVPPIIVSITESLISLRLQQIRKHEFFTRYYPAILSNNKHYVIIYSEKNDEYTYKCVKKDNKITYVNHLDISEDTLRHIISLMTNNKKERITKKDIKDQENEYYFYTVNPLCQERDVKNIFY